MNNQKVQKKKKTNKVAPFWSFVMEFKAKMIAKGHKFVNDNQVRDLAAPHWNKLTEQEKNKYKTTAKSLPAVVNKKRKIYNSLGQDTEEVEQKRRKEMNDYTMMVDEIADMLTEANDAGELDSLIFYFISTTAFYDSNEGIFPAELAMAKFSLQDGIIDDIQIRINPGKLPLGASADAKLKAESLHKYELPPNCQGEDDYLTILETIMKFLHPLEKMPVFFTAGNMRNEPVPLNETRKTIKKICYEAQEDDLMSDFKIYPIDELLYKLNAITIENKNRLNGGSEVPFSSIAYAANMLANDDYAYTTPGCDFHNEKDAPKNCCLSKVRRYGYTIARWCSNGKRYELKEGKHFPEKFKATNC